MQEKTAWQLSGRWGKVIIVVFMFLPIITALFVNLDRYLSLPSEPFPQYSCKLVGTTLVRLPIDDGKYKARAEFQYLDGQEWVTAKDDDIFWFRPRTYHVAKQVLKGLRASDDLVCVKTDDGFKVREKTDKETTSPSGLQLLFALVLLGLGWPCIVYFLVSATREKQKRIVIPIGLAFYALTLSSLVCKWVENSLHTSDWIAMECRVDFLEYREAMCADVKFQYSYLGEVYEGTRVFGDTSALGFGWPSPKLTELIRGTRTSVCYVNPSNPEEACLEKNDYTTLFMAMFLFLGLAASGFCLAKPRPRLTWQPHNPRRTLAVQFSTCLVLGSLVAWATPGFVGLTLKGPLMAQIFYIVGLIVLLSQVASLKFAFANIGFCRPRIRFREPLTQESRSGTLFLDFIDEPVPTTVKLYDQVRGTRILLDQVAAESQVTFSVEQDTLDLPLYLSVESQGRTWMIPLNTPASFFDSTSVDTFPGPRKSGITSSSQR
jgi:hypothetical protein